MNPVQQHHQQQIEQEKILSKLREADELLQKEIDSDLNDFKVPTPYIWEIHHKADSLDVNEQTTIQDIAAQQIHAIRYINKVNISNFNEKLTQNDKNIIHFILHSQHLLKDKLTKALNATE